MNEAPNLFDDGKAYERLMGRWSRLAGEKFLDWLTAPKNLKWIDVGCGNGAFTEVLIARCSPAAVVGVDPSEGQIAYARTRPGAKLAEFRVANGARGNTNLYVAAPGGGNYLRAMVVGAKQEEA